MSNCARAPLPVRISPTNDAANPNMAMRPTKSSFDLVNPRLTFQTMSFLAWKNCPGMRISKDCAGATAGAVVVFLAAGALGLDPKLKGEAFLAGGAVALLAFLLLNPKLNFFFAGPAALAAAFFVGFVLRACMLCCVLVSVAVTLVLVRRPAREL